MRAVASLALGVASSFGATPGHAAPAPPPAEAALDAAKVCYDELDYGCAETRLAEALGGELPPARRVEAHTYEALLALAWRDTIRARRAVQALLAIDPAHDPGPVPPPLAQMFAEERPAPPPPPGPWVRLDATRLELWGNDATQWTEGLGVELGGGVVLERRWLIEASVAFTDHAPQLTTLDRLTLWHGTVGVARRFALGPLWLSVGLGVGVAHVDVEGALADDDYYAAAATVPIDLNWPVWRGLGLGVRVAPLLLTTTTGDRAAASYILPLMAGLRYGD